MSITARHAAPGIGDWRPVTRDVRIDGDVVTKRATTGSDKLLREVAWLEAVPPRLAVHFPRVLAVRSGDHWAEYDMERCPWQSFSERIVRGEMTAVEAVTRTRAILEFMFAEIYVCPPGPVPSEFFRRNYVEKLRRRTAASQGRSARFDRLCESAELEVNGRRQRHPARILEWMAEDEALLESLCPPGVGRFHGDFKFDNFLIGPAADQFVLIDPRGSTPSGEEDGDYLEDVAKLRTSTLALYDLVRTRAFALSVDSERVSWVWRDEARGVESVFAAIDEALIQWMPAWAAHRGDRDWTRRLAFVTPMLLLANAPFQLVPPVEETEEIAIMLYAAGAALLEDAARAIEAGTF